MFGLSPVEFLVIGAVVLLLFGSKLPTAARSLGKSLNEFKKGVAEGAHESEPERLQDTKYTPDA